MNKIIQLTLSLAALAVSAQAQTITQTFGSGANQFQMEFVTIGYPGNVADTTGQPNPAGAVSYIYNIGKYEVSRQHIEKAVSEGGLSISLADMSSYGANGPNKPAMGLSWYEAALFVNFLNVNHGFNAAYKFGGPSVVGNPHGFQMWSATDLGYQASNPFRNNLAKFFIPSVNEWYKAAYGSPTGDWYDFPTGTDSAPTPVSEGTAPGTVVRDGFHADVDKAGGLSAFGTMAQGGNAWEWTETNNDQTNDSVDEFRMRKGGGTMETMSSTWWDSGVNPDHEHDLIGLRVAMVPEPSALSLLGIGLGLVLRRRRRTV